MLRCSEHFKATISNMLKSIFAIIMLTTSGILLHCHATSDSIAYPLPQIDANIANALENAEKYLINNTLINFTLSQSTNSIILDDIIMDTNNVTTIEMTGLNLLLSPLQVTKLTPNLRLMNLNVNATLYSVEVVGNYKVTADEPPPSTPRQGRFVLVLHAVDISGVSGLHLSENRLVTHGVDLAYRPQSVVFTVQYQTDQGFTEVNEDRSDHAEGQVTKRIFESVTYSTNIVVKNKINSLLGASNIVQILQDEDLRSNFTTFASYQSLNLNQFIDRILNTSRDELPDNLPLSKYEQRLGRKLGLVTVYAIFMAEGGWFRSLKTVRRSGDVVFNVVNGSTVLTTTLELGVLEFGYNHYAVQFAGVGPRGSVSGKVAENVIEIRLGVNIFSKDCKATLQELKVRDLEGISVRLTGLGPFNWVLSAIATSIANRSTANIIKSVEQGIAQEMREILENMDCSGHFIKKA